MKKLIISAALTFAVLGSGHALAHYTGPDHTDNDPSHKTSRYLECFDKNVWAETTLRSDGSLTAEIAAEAWLHLCHFPTLK